MRARIVYMPDAEFERRAQAGGPFSVERDVIHKLQVARAKDCQHFAFEVGDYYFTGPLPDARTQFAMLALADAGEEGLVEDE